MSIHLKVKVKLSRLLSRCCHVVYVSCTQKKNTIRSKKRNNNKWCCFKRKRDTYSKINDDPGATSSSTSSLSSPSVSFCSMKMRKETAYWNSCREQHDSRRKRRKREKKMTYKSWYKSSQLESKCVSLLQPRVSCRLKREEGYRKDSLT